YVTGVLYLGNSNANSIYKHKLSVNASTLTRPAIFKGMFLAETIYSMKNTNWYMSGACSDCTPVDIKNLASEYNTPVNITDRLIANYPNPFTDKTTLAFMLPEDNHVKLEVYDLSGKLLQTLFYGDVTGGQHYTAVFDGNNLSAGMFIYRMTTNNEVVSGKIILRK
ncbi:MAG: T9SS type A sorting domain-containing protein, partial [Bacteroidota bacterium]